MAYISKKTLLSSLRIAKSYIEAPYISRTLATNKKLAGNYEGDGKTTVTILNKDHKNIIMIDSYSNYGFRLNNGIFVLGPLAAFPRTILQWNVTNVAGLTPESLSLFGLVEPKLDILVLGTGDKAIMPSKFVLDYLKKNKIRSEILSTPKACAHFNFLNSERRCVAGAFIPPTDVQMFEDEIEILGECDVIDKFEDLPETKIQG